MTSSNGHWPSMFKSNPTNPPPHFSFPGGDGERSMETKPRWNPMPKQIRILEEIVNSGMVNPPRDEIPRIRARLQEFGQVGDASVYYWFQNRKSRTKNKLRKLKPSPTTTSSTSSDKASPNLSLSSFYQSNEPPFLPSSQGFGYPGSSSCVSDQNFGYPGSSSWVGDQNFGYLGSSSCVSDQNCSIVLVDHDDLHDHQIDKRMNLPQQQIITPTQPMHVPHNILPDLGETAPQKMTIFINDVCYEVATAPFNVRQAFGDDAVLQLPFGFPVLTHQSGLTHHPLQNGARYYLVNRNFNPNYLHHTTNLD